MNAVTGIAILILGSALGAFGAIATGLTRAWQVLIGALVGVAVADLIVRRLAARAAVEALNSQRDGALLIASAHDLSWRERLTPILVLVVLALTVGSVALLARRFLTVGPVGPTR